LSRSGSAPFARPWRPALRRGSRRKLLAFSSSSRSGSGSENGPMAFPGRGARTRHAWSVAYTAGGATCGMPEEPKGHRRVQRQFLRIVPKIEAHATTKFHYCTAPSARKAVAEVAPSRGAAYPPGVHAGEGHRGQSASAWPSSSPKSVASAAALATHDQRCPVPTFRRGTPRRAADEEGGEHIAGEQAAINADSRNGWYDGRRRR